MNKIYMVLLFLSLAIVLILSVSAQKPSFEIAPKPEPTIEDTTLSSGSILPGSPVTITSKASDVSGIDSVMAVIKNAEGQTIDTITLYDDGNHNDGARNDGIYGNTWNSANNTAGEYKVSIRAVDKLGKSAISEERDFDITCIERVTEYRFSGCTDGQGTCEKCIARINEVCGPGGGYVDAIKCEAEHGCTGYAHHIGCGTCPETGAHNCQYWCYVCPEKGCNDNGECEPGLGETVENCPGDCKVQVPDQKDLTKYSDKEVFLISDKNWKDVLSLVPVTTRTGEENCNKGYGTPDNVCIYPTLIFHENLDFIVYDKPITTDPNDQIEPSISGNKIVWEDNRNGNSDIYMYDLSTNQEKQITTDPNEQSFPSISGDKIVWQDYRNGNSDIYMYDLSTNQEIQITTDPNEQSFPSISGDKIVWQDYRNGNSDIYLYDLSTNQEKQITTDPTTQFFPSISGDKIVWVDNRNNNWDIYMYDLSTNQEKQITTDPTTQFFPSISGDKIVWGDDINGNRDIYMYDLSTNQEKQITTDPDNQESPSISGDKIVWVDNRNNNWDIYLYDLSTNQEIQITTDQNQQFSPSILEDKIIWTGDRNGNYDIYMYDENGRIIPGEGFDADSIIYFMQQYSPNKVTIIGEIPQELNNLLIAQQEHGAGLSQEQIQRISVNDCLSYWESYTDVVYVEDNYELALIASTYASLINTPLIIQGTSLDSDNVFTNKNVICVGNVDRTCNENYNLEQLQQKYVDETNTDKIILINPDDLGIKVVQSFIPEKSANPVYEIYSKNSLAAPILASAKHELIISTTSTDYSDVDSFIENKTSNLQITPEYLTIIASPNAIEMVYRPNDYNYYSADAWHYSKLDNDAFLDLAVGRIFGLTIADSSSNIARSLFYEETLENEDKILVTRGSPLYTTAAEVYAMGRALSVTGYQTTTTPASTTANDWKDKFFIVYDNHGSYNWAGILWYEIPYLDNAFIIASACDTCAFKGAFYKKQLFCANIIRKGGVGYIGATDSLGGLNTIGFLAEVFSQESTIGKAFINSKNSLIVWGGHLNNVDTIDPDHNYMGAYTLVGDPTLKLKTIHTMSKPELSFVSDTENGKNYKLTVPAMRFEIPDDVKNVCEVPQQVETLYFTTAYNCNLGWNDIFTLRFPTIKNFNVISAQEPSGNSFVWVDKQTPDYLWITLSTKDYWNYRYFTTANDYEFKNFEFEIEITGEP